MNHIAMLLCSGSLAVMVRATEWKPTSDYLKAVRIVESSNGVNLYGDNGQSLGAYQLSEGAWLDVNAWRRLRGLKTYTYEDSVYHSYISRVYASNYLTILHSELSRKLNRAPTGAELYAAYNLGLASFAQCKYEVNRVNAVTRARCQQISTLLQGRESL